MNKVHKFCHRINILLVSSAFGTFCILTYNRLDLQTLGSQPVMPTNLPDHWYMLTFYGFPLLNWDIFYRFL